VKRLTILALVLAIAGSACTRVDSVGTNGRHSWTRPGVLRLASINDPDTLSPLVGNYQVDVDLSMFWAGYLFNYDDKDQPVPELAVSLPTRSNGGISADGRAITYHLRKGVSWQDGEPFDARDVIFSWHAVMNPNNNVGSRQGYEDIERIDAPTAFTVVVHLKQPFGPFVNTFFTMGATAIPLYPRHLLEKYPDLNRVAYNSAPIGTGPFKVLEWHRGEVLRMVANPHYWRGAPKLAEVDYQAFPDENTLLTSIQSHSIDLWYNAPSALYRSASTVPDTRVILTPFTQYSWLGFNIRRPNVSDVRVRRALAMALDRKRMIETVTFGVNVLGEGDQPAFSWAHDAALKSLPYDPAGARALLDAAGWKPGADGVRQKNRERLRIEVATIAGSATGNRVAVLAQAAWHDIGAEAVIKQYSSSLMLASFGAGGIVQTGRYDVQLSSWVNGVDPDDSANVMCDQIPPRGQNTSRFCDAVVDAQERIATTSYDETTRRRAYAVVQQKLVDEVPFITTWFWRRFDVVSVDVKGYKPAHAVTTFWNTWEYSI
jgi:peptide/nickel transport system substrate-binding protein